MLTQLTVVGISKYKQIQSQYIVHIKLIIMFYVNYTSFLKTHKPTVDNFIISANFSQAFLCHYMYSYDQFTSFYLFFIIQLGHYVNFLMMYVGRLHYICVSFEDAKGVLKYKMGIVEVYHYNGKSG